MMTTPDSSPNELFKYRVVYPGGCYVRNSPDMNSDKIGEILEFGTTFESSKSLYLDGINYIKYNNGWVFETKGKIKILELLEVKRGSISHQRQETIKPILLKDIPSKYIAVTESSPVNFKNNSHTSTIPTKDKLIRISRNEHKYWKEIKIQSLKCQSFHEFLSFVCQLEEIQTEVSNKSASTSHLTVSNSVLTTQQIQSISVISAWIPQSSREKEILRLVKLLTSITTQCVENISNCQGLESALWVLVHLGNLSTIHILEFTVDLANEKYETLSLHQQDAILNVISDVSNRIKLFCNELSKLVDVLPDDIQNFVQRWILIKIIDHKFRMQFAAPEPVLSDINDDMSVKLVCSDDEDTDEDDATIDDICNIQSRANKSNTQGALSVFSNLLSVMNDKVSSVIKSALPQVPVHDIPLYNLNSNDRTDTELSDSNDEIPVNANYNFNQIPLVYHHHWNDLKYRVHKFMNDPNLQFANVI